MLVLSKIHKLQKLFKTIHESTAYALSSVTLKRPERKMRDNTDQ